jgi:hypothetical protein
MMDLRNQLRAWYGLGFPDDLFAVWELANELRPKAPRDAFEAIALHLDGVFDVLAGQFDRKRPDKPLWTHGMSYHDPPEFLTIFWGECDGYHLGFWFDDPAEPPSCVVSYYNNDAYDLEHYPANLFLTLRRELERSYESTLENLEDDPEDADFYQDLLRRHDELREALRPRLPGATRRRKQKGGEYLGRYTDQDVDDGQVVAYTWGHEYIAAPRALYREPSADDETIWREVRARAGAVRWLAEAKRALREGYPATALKLGKDVWHLAPKGAEADACAVMEAAYHALGRPLLAQVLRARQQQRDRWDAERVKAGKAGDGNSQSGV